MNARGEKDSVAISLNSKKVLLQLLEENPVLARIIKESNDPAEGNRKIREWVWEWMESHPLALKCYQSEYLPRDCFEKLAWDEYGAIRILDYLDHTGMHFQDLNRHGMEIENDPFKLVWLAYHKGSGGAEPAFFMDMLHLFRQFSGKKVRKIPTFQQVREWMDRYPSGLNPRIVAIRNKNRDRILNLIIDKMDQGIISDHKYFFPPGVPRSEKLEIAKEWWKERLFHLRFAIRSPEQLQEMLKGTLSPSAMKILKKAKIAGIPTFVNPYYLSLLLIDEFPGYHKIDQAIRDYVIYSKELVKEFGDIVAWEKEDIVEPGKPNAAGFLLPSHHNVHRRYPEVAILIPDTMGRACGGLCASCQRMYDFQSGRLNFNLKELLP